MIVTKDIPIIHPLFDGFIIGIIIYVYVCIYIYVYVYNCVYAYVYIITIIIIPKNHYMISPNYPTIPVTPRQASRAVEWHAWNLPQITAPEIDKVGHPVYCSRDNPSKNCDFSNKKEI